MVRQQAAYIHSLYADRNSLRIIDTAEAGETGQAQVSIGKTGVWTIPRPHRESRKIQNSKKETGQAQTQQVIQREREREGPQGLGGGPVLLNGAGGGLFIGY